MMYHMPALLQTADYARAIIKGIAPKINPEILGERVEVRLRRQQLLGQDRPLRYRAILDEAVLRLQVGGMAVMQAQRRKSWKWNAPERRRSRSSPLMPVRTPRRIAASCSWSSMRLSSPLIVYVEGLVRPSYHDRKDEVARYREAIDYLRDSALSPRDSMALIDKMLKAYDEGRTP